MKRREFLKNTGKVALLMVSAQNGVISFLPASQTLDIESDFANPPSASRPYTFWFWMNGNISKEGLTLDLEAMQKAGIGGVLVFEAGVGIAKGPVVFHSEKYWDLKKHSIQEAARLGLDYGMHNCPGWTSSGGPWITPELSMQKLTSSEQKIDGGKKITIILAEPEKIINYYRDIAVLAFIATGDEANKTIAKDSSVLDITACMEKDGTLNWNAPAGHWTVLRIGVTTTGAKNRPAPDGGEGLECDKFSREALELHFNNMVRELVPVINQYAGQIKIGMEIDSYEVGRQDWTPEFPSEFKKRMGYEVLLYLPVLFGYTVHNKETTERLRWDIRRVQADLMAENYYGFFQELCHRHQIVAYSEPYEPGNMEELQAGSYADRVMGEFWLGQGNNRSVKLTASIAHTYGKKFIGTEAFTGGPFATRWQEHPYGMKTTGDWMYSQGTNKFIFHRFAHQPHPTAAPGMQFGPWGFFFERSNTWFSYAKPWLTYLTRCQYMLEKGNYVADLLYFSGENPGEVVPVLADDFDLAPPPGVEWDIVHADLILSNMTIESGKIVLPGGTSYKMLVLNKRSPMRVKTLQKIHQLVQQGMTLVGPAPDTFPGYAENTPGHKEEFRRLCRDLWKEDGNQMVNSFGKGKVIAGRSLQSVFEMMGYERDLEITSRSGNSKINFIHRREGDTDIYFIANRKRVPEEIVCTFRVKGKQPELWYPDTGAISNAMMYELAGSRVSVPLSLAPAESVFVVFKTAASSTGRITKIEKDQKLLLSCDNYPVIAPGRFPHVYNNFTISVWVRPDTIIIFNPKESIFGGVEPELNSFIINAVPGAGLYGEAHAIAGFTAGRDCIRLFEQSTTERLTVLEIEMPLIGFHHITVVYKEKCPMVYVDGVFVQKGKPSQFTVHPGIGEPSQKNEGTYFDGHMSDLQLFKQALSDDQVRELARRKPSFGEVLPLQVSRNGSKEVFISSPGSYTFYDHSGKKKQIAIQTIVAPLLLMDNWRVKFPPQLGAPAEIMLHRLKSLHAHNDPGVRYFSGTSVYTKSFTITPAMLGSNKKLFLDLGRVDVIAAVKINKVDAGILWKPPFTIDITGMVHIGTNTIEVKVTNQWVNRLIGDEQFPEEYEYTGGGDYTTFGAKKGIAALPAWYTTGQPKPPGNRITFATWRLYKKHDLLMESGLIGPVSIRTILVIKP